MSADVHNEDLLAMFVAVDFKPRISRSKQRRFWRRTAEALRQHSLVFGQIEGVCVVPAVGHQFGTRDRHRVMEWLIDQPRSKHIHWLGEMPAEDISKVPFDPEDMEVTVEGEMRVRAFLHYVVMKAFHQYERALLDATGALRGTLAGTPRAAPSGETAHSPDADT